MAGFNERERNGMMRKSHQKNLFRGVKRAKAIVIAGLLILIPLMVQAEAEKKVAVLPFRIHSLEPLDHLKQGLQEMFTTRLAQKGISVVPLDVVNRHPMAFLPMFKMEDIVALGRDLKAEQVLTGSLTRIGKQISLDLRLMDIARKKPPFSIFIVEDDIEKLAEAADRGSKSLYNQIVGVMQIDSIQVKGNRRIESEAILALVESKKGDPIDYDQLDKDLRAVYAMGFFKDVTIDTEDGPKGKIITINVSEKRSIASITFKGNKKEDDDDLKKETGISLYSILNLSEIRQSINRMKDYYRQKGFYNVDIRESIEDLPNNEVSLTYQIEEGEKVYVTRIEFVGNTEFDDGDLKDLMETSEKGLLSWFTKSGMLDKKKLEFDLHKVISFYQNQGYIRAKAGEPKITYEEGKGLIITTEIIEGPQYGVSEVKVEGDLIKPVDELIKKLNISKEKFFNREVVRNDTLALRDIYANEGFAYTDVTPVTKEDDERHLVDITYKVSKGAKVRFERINITGNTITRDKVIRRELKVIEGEYFSGKDLSRSTENLHRLGFFEDVEVKTKKGNQDDLMVLDINVKEKPTGSFSIGAGYSSFENLMGTLEVSQGNLFGRGQRLGAKTRLGSRTTLFDVQFIEPWLFDVPLSLGVNIFKWEREYYEYTKDSVGGALRFGFPTGLDEYTRASVKYEFDDADIFNIKDGAGQALLEMEGKNVTSSVTLGIKRDSTDRPWNASKGSINSLAYTFAGGFMGGDVYFDRYDARSSWYFPLPWKTVFLAQGHWGYMSPRSGGKLPIYQKYRLGGINTIRGFDYLTISPKDPKTRDSIGGVKMMYYNFEYRFPLLKQQGVVGIVFFDAGNVYTEDDSYSFSEIKKSSGVGIRWYSPLGPLRVEYGKNLDPKDDEKSGNWEFTVGGFF
jgi:outer membrane protein insertion porin family